MSLTQAIKEQAYALGFSLVGVTSAEPLPHAEVFELWLKEGRQGEMAYLESERSRERRAHPERILPGCRSLLALGMRCPAPIAVPDVGSAPRGRVAAYAWGADYHDIFPERLQSLVQFIEAQAGHAVPNRWYTDTGPILEREVFQRAGLGWIGKNTCLINPHQGSYFLLAEILLGIELEPDPPFTADRCGTCSRCIHACPTDCILPDRTLDARRCISYLTIELKGAIPFELRSSMGSWIFGCDICQQVCPWNQRFATPLGDAGLAPRHGTAQPDLLQELALTPEAFRDKFGRQEQEPRAHSPVKRAKRRGYLRNVCVALGNSKDPAAVPGLQQALLTDPEPLVREHSAWALGQIGGQAAKEALEIAWQGEANEQVQAEIRLALEHAAPGG
jgi:epoxyqueuosine reductase